MSDRYAEVVASLRDAYDAAVEARAGRSIDPWKARERQQFLDLLRTEQRRSLLEIGAGTGVHGRFFADAGIEVVCTDLSPQMVAHCRRQGLEAYVRGFLELDLDREFDSVFAMNCLLHVPREDLGEVLLRIRDVTVPSGLLYIGQYGGVDHDGVFDEDSYEPKRYFSWLTDDHLLAVVNEVFTVESFAAVDIGSPDGAHFQSLVARRVA